MFDVSVCDTVESYDENSGEEADIEYSHSDGVKLNKDMDTDPANSSSYTRKQLLGAGFAAAALGGGAVGGTDYASEQGSAAMDSLTQYMKEAASNPENTQRVAEASQWAQEVVTSLS